MHNAHINMSVLCYLKCSQRKIFVSIRYLKFEIKKGAKFKKQRIHHRLNFRQHGDELYSTYSTVAQNKPHVGLPTIDKL